MALRAGTRRWLMRLAFGVLLVASSLLLGLRLGRPLYYSDGAQQYDGAELAHAGMLQWRAPQPVGELPGPVAGRVARLGDGRFLYGRLQQDGTADLVLFDPRHPALPPEPLFAANSAANDLAPCVLADGRVLFASDRDGGHGGYDLYELPSTTATAASVRPWTICNTALDESDPAVAGDGTLVFVRSDRRIDGGNDGVLFRWREGDATEPERLFADPGRSAARIVDRDPAFAADGASLWFVRKQAGQPLRVLRASRLGATFAPPLPVLASSTDLRSPLPAADGRAVGLLQAKPGEAVGALWYEAAAQELVPWWPGQSWLEWLLLGAIVSSLLLLVLLHYGRRWSTLDLLAQCLLLSLLLHVLLFLWLMGVEILGAPLPGDDDGGSVEVALVATSSSDAANGELAAQAIAAEVRMAASERTLQAELPGTATVKASAAASLAAAEAARDEALPAAAATTTAVPALADAPAAQPLRDASDAPAADAAAAELAAVAAQAPAAPAAPPAPSSHAATSAVVVAVPAAGNLARSERGNVEAPAASAPASTALAPVAHAAPPTPALQDAATPATAWAGDVLRAAADAPRATLQSATIAVDGVEAAEVAVARSSAAQASSMVGSAAPRPASALAKTGEQALAAPSAALVEATPANAAARVSKPEVALRDAASSSSGSAPVRGERVDAAAAAKPVAVATAPAAPVADAGAAAQRRAENGDRAAPVAAVPMPGGALVRAGGTLPATAAAGTPASSSASPRAGTGPAPVALRDAAASGPASAPPANATANAAARANTNPAAPRSTPAAALPPVAAAGAEVAAARARETGSLPQPATSLPRPAGALVRAAAPVSVPAGAPSPASAAAAARPQPTPAAIALRDRGAPSAPATSPVAAAAAGVRSKPTPSPSVLPALAAGASSVVAERAPWRGERTLPPEPPPAPPESRLARAPAAPLAAGEAELRVAGTAYSNRFGPAKAQAIERFGGNDATERAVQNGLRYLARIQNRDGSWGDRSDYDGKYGFVYVGKTALCVLAFLGAGHTPQSRSEHSAVVKRALDHLLALQEEDTGAFGRSSCYGHGIATYALAECYGLTKDDALLRPLERALQWILDHQGPRRDRRNRGGWGYFSPGLRAEDDTDTRA